MQQSADLKPVAAWDRCYVKIFGRRRGANEPPDARQANLWRGAVSIDTSGGNPAMDYHEHTRTYAAFVMGAKWLVGFIVLILVLMAITLL